uniref:ubiquitinyl hydrolase 1 n=2 Tax=Callorhinchus milii TaxID=7868 RepID=A0A4W3IXP8_CALMI
METKSSLPQSLSESNLIKAVKLRHLISDNIIKPSTARPLIHHLLNMNMHTLQLHSMREYQPQFRRTLEQSLMDQVTSKALADAGTLNWCKELRKQFPLKVSGDGNSLLHSLSLCMWGVKDTDLTLSKTFHEALTKTNSVNFRLRWQTEHGAGQHYPTTGLCDQSAIWDAEWQNMIDSSAPVSQACTSLYQDMHLFILANIARRPIIVIAESSKGNSKKVSDKTSSPAGIYLPLHWPAEQCFTYPILLSYTQQRFTPLVSINDPGPQINAFPLVTPSRSGSEELPVRFLLDKERLNKKQLLSNYLVVITIPDSNSIEMFLAARLQINPLPDDLNLVQDYFQLVNHEYGLWQKDTDKGETHKLKRAKEQKFCLSNLSIVEERCLTPNCSYFCSKFTKPFCHTCHEAFQKEATSSRAKTLPSKQGGHTQVMESQSKAGTTFEQLSDRSTGSSSALPSASSPVHFFSETNALKCRILNCPFTGSLAQNGLCPSCFRRSEPLEQIPETGRNTSPCFPNSSNERCSTCNQETSMFNGLCFVCLRRSGSYPQSQVLQGRTSESTPDSLSTTGHPAPQGGRDQGQAYSQTGKSAKCIKPNCQYFGTEEQFDYCTVCFLNYLTVLETSGQRDPERQDHKSNSRPAHAQCVQISSHLRNMSVCCSAGCSMLANPVYNGHCEKCYVYTQSKSSHRSKSVSDVPTEPAVWSPAAQCHRDYSASSTHGLSERNSNEHFGSELRSGKGVSGHLQPAHGHPSPSARPNTEPERMLCRRRGCEHFGNTKCDGYCNACFTASRIHRM